MAPAELEALLLRHEAVNDVAVIPMPDEASGELPRAYIVQKEGTETTVTEQDIYQWGKLCSAIVVVLSFETLRYCILVLTLSFVCLSKKSRNAWPTTNDWMVALSLLTPFPGRRAERFCEEFSGTN